MRIPERSITSGIMLLVFLFFLVQAMFFGPLARGMPLLISVPGVVLCFAQFVIDWRSKPAETDHQPAFSGNEARTAAWIVGFIIGISLLGFNWGSPLMAASYLYFHAGQRLRVALIAAVACVAFTYGFMDRLMGIQLYEGLLFGYLS
jgi:hypothetical protein